MLFMTLQNSLSMTFVGKKFEFYHCILFNVSIVQICSCNCEIMCLNCVFSKKYNGFEW